MIAPSLTGRAAAAGSLTLSSEEVEKLTRAVELLISPLEYSSVDTWRASVNRELKSLLHADSAGFLLPVEDGLMLYSEEHDPAELARYQDYPPPPLVDGTPLWQAMLINKVGTLATIYGRDYHLYTNSTYYQEYSGANNAHDTLAAATSLGGSDARGMACLHFWHERPDARLFGAREVALMKVLYPAFKAGIETHVQLGEHRSNLFASMDALGQAIMVCDRAGRLLHQTPSLCAILDADPERAMLRGELLSRNCCARDVTTGTARYGIRGTLYGNSASSTSVFLMSLERRTPKPLAEGELREAFGLTRAEVRVATLIARGCSNAAIAQQLTISPHTARRHTERVLLKLGAKSRSEVAARLFR